MICKQSFHREPSSSLVSKMLTLSLKSVQDQRKQFLQRVDFGVCENPYTYIQRCNSDLIELVNTQTSELKRTRIKHFPAVMDGIKMIKKLQTFGVVRTAGGWVRKGKV